MSLEQELTSLLRRMESRHFEHLSAGSPLAEAAHAVCAFLNSEGGTVLVESGVQPVVPLVNAIESELREKLHPPALWLVTPIEREGAGYCLVDVPAGRDRPYTVDGTIYLRKERTTAAASAEEIRALVEDGFRDMERWERRLIPGAGLNRLDEGLIFGIAQQARERRQLSLGNKVEQILTALNLFRDGMITNAAEVLFGRNPAQQFPQVRVRVTVYATDKGGDLPDNRPFQGPAFRVLEEVFAMLRPYMSVSATFKDGLQRTDKPGGYPEAAIREGLVNAFAHRDYANFSGGISVDVYPSRLVIWNAGTLPAGLKIGDLTREHPSMPRNPDIAQVFFLHGYMERIGRGTQKIVSACTEAGLDWPKWKADEAGVTLTFSSKTKKGAATLNLREQRIVGELKLGQSIRLPEYCERMTVSERQGRRDLGNLVDGGWMEREGDGPTTVFRRTPKEWQPAKPGQTRPE